MIALRPRDQHMWDPRPVPHETEAETKTNYVETETETYPWFKLGENYPTAERQLASLTDYVSIASVLFEGHCYTELAVITSPSVAMTSVRVGRERTGTPFPFLFIRREHRFFVSFLYHVLELK